MSEYIEREALLRALSKEVEYDDDGEQEINSDTVFITIEDFSAADVAQVVHGRWEFKYEGTYRKRRSYCSVCGRRSGIGGIIENQKKPYCPNCGALMDGGNDNGKAD